MGKTFLDSYEVLFLDILIDVSWKHLLIEVM